MIKFMMNPSIFLLLLSLMCGSGEASKVLFISSPVGGSHTMHMSKLANMLAENSDHQVFFLRNDLQAKAKTLDKVKDVVVHDPEGAKMLDVVTGKGSALDPKFGRWNMTFGRHVFGDMARLFNATCDAMFRRVDVWQSLAREGFDLVLIEDFPSCLFMASAHYINAPIIHYSTSHLISGAAYHLGVPAVPSYMKSAVNPLNADMTNPTFINRAKNLVGYVVETYFFYFATMQCVSNRVAEEHLGDEMPDVAEVIRSSSLIMVHADTTFHRSKPILPNQVLLGGIMCVDAKPLAKEWQDVMSRGSKGTIYVAFGTYISVGMMGDGMVDLLLDVFNQLEGYTILWKLDSVPEGRVIPAHVKVKAWMPQQDILGDERTKVFISHGGLNSMYEAMYHAVPTLVLPLLGDQLANADNMVDIGMGKTLDKNNLHMEDIVSAVRDLATDKYQKAAKKISVIFRDHPQTPRERFLFWINYVLRHKGAPHLRINTHSLNIFHYYNMDIFLCLLVVPLALIYIVVRLCCCRGKRHEQRQPQMDSKKRK